jgi:predicted XRE-type DNA-binding protein
MKSKIRESSGNVFADLSLPNPEETLAKAQIVGQIHKIIKKRRLTQAKVAKILRLTQPKVSLLLRGYFKDFSLERLFRFLNDLGQDVVISVGPSKNRKHGHTRISSSPFSKPSIAALSK